MDYTTTQNSAEPEKTDFRWERKPHPMCIPHIVDSILAYLSVPDLKTCRLVSSQYNEIACKALQREETITFKTIPQLETYLSNIKPISKSLLSTPTHHPDLLKPHHHDQSADYSASLLYSSSELSSLASIEGHGDDEELYLGEEMGTDLPEESGDGVEHWPYFDTSMTLMSDGCEYDDQEGYFHPPRSPLDYSQHRYSHRSFHFDYCDPSEEIAPLEQFFSKFGPQIRRLKYTTDILPYNFPKPLRHMGEIWQDRLSNLEELSLEMKWGVPASLYSNADEQDPRRLKVLLPNLRRLHLDILLTDRDADRAQIFLQQLLAITPNVEEISIPGSKRFFDDYINVILARVIISSEVRRLSELNFCLALSDAQMRLLMGKNLPLSSLIIDLEDLQLGDGLGNNLEEGRIHDIPPQDNNDLADVDIEDGGDDDDLRHDFFRQNNRRPSFSPILKSTLQRFFLSLSPTLRSLHICFPQTPQHTLHTFTFLAEMTELKFLALGYFAGSSKILDQLPALKRLELWNVQFRDCHGQERVVPDKYQGITSVIS